MKKYISEIHNENFVYPNNNPSEYDVTISHTINNNCVSGMTSGITVTDVSTTGLTIEYDWSWALNGAEPFLNQDGEQVFFTVHALPYGSNFFKPWKMVSYFKDTYSGLTSASGGGEITITNDQFNLEYFQNGDYYFEFRFIGHRAVYSSTATVTISSLPQLGPWLLINAVPAGTGVVQLNFTGGTLECGAVAAQYSRNQYQWYENTPTTSYCNSPAYCSHGNSTGTWYFRLKMYVLAGGFVYSNIVSYTYQTIQLMSVSGISANEYQLIVIPAGDCDGLIVEWSRNQIDWVGVGTEFSCDVGGGELNVNTGDQTNIPYWRVVQYTTDDIPAQNISNISLVE